MQEIPLAIPSDHCSPRLYVTQMPPFVRPSDFHLSRRSGLCRLPSRSALSTENRLQCVRHSLASTSYWNPPPVPFSPRLSSPPLTPPSSIASDLPFHAVASPPWPAPRRISSRVVSSPTASPWSPSIGPKPSTPWISVHSSFTLLFPSTPAILFCLDQFLSW